MFADDDIVVRCALFPRFLKSNVADPLALFSFRPLGTDSGVFATSIGARQLLPTIEEVHDFGCKTAADANSRKERDEGRELQRPVETVHYRGSYELSCGSIRAIDDEVFGIELKHEPEPQREAHSHIELTPKKAGVSKTQMGKARTRIIADLVSILRSPVEHICPCDEDLRSFLEEYRLPSV